MSADNASIEQRAGEPVVDAQDGLFDQVVDNDVLERALEKREVAKGRKAEATKAFNEAHAQASALIGELNLEEDTVIRVGHFRLKYSRVEARSVSFDTGETTRLTISMLGEEN